MALNKVWKNAPAISSRTENKRKQLLEVAPTQNTDQEKTQNKYKDGYVSNRHQSFSSVRDNTNSLYLTILHLTLGIHKQISYFTVSMTTHDISHMFFKEEKVKITLSVKLNFSPSPHIFY